MRKIEHRTWICLLIAGVLAVGLAIFVVLFFVNGGDWVAASFNRHLYSSSGTLLTGRVLDRDGNVLSQVEDGERTYGGNAEQRRAVLHVVGDLQGKIGTGALTAFADQLTGYNPVTGVAAAEAGGSDLYLTIDLDCQLAAWRALGGRKGTVILYNYKTGEILCLVSSPAYDPENVPEDLESDPAYEGAYINRALRATFTPGSIMKTVTLHAAIEELPDLFDRTWTCTGSIQIGDQTVTCTSAHGEETIGQAFSNSCNCVFGLLTVELGADTLARYVEQSGFTSSYSVNGIPTLASSIPLEGLSDGMLAWAGVGQAQDAVNPLSMAVYMGAIANGGRSAVPRLIHQVDGALIPASWSTRHTGTLINADTAQTLADMMAYNVTSNYGSSRFGDLDMGAKSGTAEVGSDKTPHAWFAGFVRDENYPYAFVVLVENGGSGSQVAGDVAAAVLAAATS